jgi:hypothetical protein
MLNNINLKNLKFFRLPAAVSPRCALSCSAPQTGAAGSLQERADANRKN